jgi:hypothetical protein
MLIDKNANYRNRPVVLEPAIFFGQLQHIFVVQLTASKTLKLAKPETLILAAIRTCSDRRLEGNGIYYYTEEGRMEVVDMSCVQCLVGRVSDRGRWAIIDRSESSARPVFTLDDEC